MTYARNFSDGERQAFKDRQLGIHRRPPADMSNLATQAYWDGYLPRSPEWAGRSTQPVQAWWVERESEFT